MTTELVFEVPLPPVALSPNRKLHHMVKASAVAAYREDVRRLAASAAVRRREGWTPMTRARVELVFGTRRQFQRQWGGGPNLRVMDELYRPRDEANATAAAKALYDGLVSAGLLVDDSAEHMEAGRVRIDTTWGPGVRVTVTRVQCDCDRPAGDYHNADCALYPAKVLPL